MEYTIRQARIGDAHAIALVHVESWRSTYIGILPEGFLAALDMEERTRQWRQWLISDACKAFVAEDESGIVGFAAGGKSRDASYGYDSELYAIYLLNVKQRQGIGGMLAYTLAKSLSAAGFSSMLVWVLEKNPAVLFYQRLGAVPIGGKSVEIGGSSFSELVFGWASLQRLTTATQFSANRP